VLSLPTGLVDIARTPSYLACLDDMIAWRPYRSMIAAWRIFKTGETIVYNHNAITRQITDRPYSPDARTGTLLARVVLQHLQR